MDLRALQQQALGLYGIFASLALTEATTRAGTTFIDRLGTADCWLQVTRLSVFLCVVVRVYLSTGEHITDSSGGDRVSKIRVVGQFAYAFTNYLILSFWAISIDRPSNWLFYVLMLLALTYYVPWSAASRAGTFQFMRSSLALDVAAAVASLVVRAMFWALARVTERADVMASHYSEVAAFVPVILISLFDMSRRLGMVASSR